MPNFGKYGFVGETKHMFDEEPQWYWLIKSITAGMELENSKFLAHRRLVMGPDGRTELPPTAMEVAFHEIALTFGGTNIPLDDSKPVEEGGEPIIPKDASMDVIMKALGTFPRAILMEIWRAIGQSYPFWGPTDPNAI
jgi:hypothetical protein